MLRDAVDDDMAVLRRWRNHPEVRAASFTTHEIGADEHRRWWEGVRADPSRRVLVYEHRGEPAGVVTFTGLDPAEASGWWGFYLDVDGLSAAGELLPAWIALERAAVEHAFGPLGLRTLRGEVLADNDAVLRLHLRCGFTEERRYVRTVDGADREVVRLELRRAAG